MLAFAASIGWGLIAVGAVTHLLDHGRLRELLAMHIDNERWPAAALTTLEAVITVLLPVAYVGRFDSLLTVTAIGAAALGLGFVAWVARLLMSDSGLPCACSFSAAPPTVWSLGRAACVVFVAAFVVVADTGTTTISTATSVATLVTGLAAAAAIYVLPEAITWPPASRALLARVDAFDTSGEP